MSYAKYGSHQTRKQDKFTSDRNRVLIYLYLNIILIELIEFEIETVCEIKYN